MPEVESDWYVRPKPTKGYVMPVKQGAYEKVNAAVKEALLAFVSNEEEVDNLLTALVQKKIPFTRIEHSRSNYERTAPRDRRYRGSNS